MLYELFQVLVYNMQENLLLQIDSFCLRIDVQYPDKQLVSDILYQVDGFYLKMHFYLKFLLQQGVVQAEPWMTPFLKASLADTNLLVSNRLLVDEELHNVESMVRHYIENASVH